MRSLVRDRLPIFTEEESNKLKDSFDFIGLNYYTSAYVKDRPYNYTDEPTTCYDDPQIDITPLRGGVPLGLTRFGLTYIDYTTNPDHPDLTRRPKQSARWLKRFLSNIKKHKLYETQETADIVMKVQPPVDIITLNA
ncbi:hypothetical protein HPP92_012905 [Vanilla planifolia]|uniref:Beta-glucosidase n=1 Tax=Vanilla planifolia TaxID=51239 RepID=A0A835QW34_VANPL|nr:hypothetical protein HPP92_012905 [Vanilla planifolia]